jgi:hypothetical protein
MSYTILRSPGALGSPAAEWGSKLWAGSNTLDVAIWPWAPGTTHAAAAHTSHLPRVQARLMWDPSYLAVMFRVEDHFVRAVAAHPWNGTDSVCTDSCVEFFVSPVAGSDAYLNCEVNCGGTMLIGAHGGVLGEVEVAAEDRGTIPMAATMPARVEPEQIGPQTWCVEYHLPTALLKKYFGEEAAVGGAGYRANFYKCADRTSHPHWGCWSPVWTSQPSFHQPGSFRPLAFSPASAPGTILAEGSLRQLGAASLL